MLVSPPRDRPSASRFLSFGCAPRADRGAQLRRRQPRRIHISRRPAPRPGRMLVRPDHGRIHRDRPPLARALIAPGPQPIQDHLPGPIAGPAAMPVINRLPVPEPLRQIPPRVTRTGPVEDPVNHQPVIIPPVPLPRMRRAAAAPAAPTRHRSGHAASAGPHPPAIQRKRPTKIYGTRPSLAGCSATGTFTASSRSSTSHAASLHSESLQDQVPLRSGERQVTSPKPVGERLRGSAGPCRCWPPP